MTCTADDDSYLCSNIVCFEKLWSYVCNVELGQRHAWCESYVIYPMSVRKLERDYRLRLLRCASSMVNWNDITEKKETNSLNITNFS